MSRGGGGITGRTGGGTGGKCLEIEEVEGALVPPDALGHLGGQRRP